nr:MAG TPA: hypothetical protein [Caudoviricetes sp.]
MLYGGKTPPHSLFVYADNMVILIGNHKTLTLLSP